MFTTYRSNIIVATMVSRGGRFFFLKGTTIFFKKEGNCLVSTKHYLFKKKYKALCTFDMAIFASL
jgi:hypothetical protein